MKKPSQQKRSWAVLLAAGLGLLGACGRQLDKAGDTVDLQGDFQTQISQEVSIRAGGVGCVVHELEVNPSQMKITQTAYADINCAGKAIGKFVTESDYKVGNELVVAPGARELDLKISKVTVIPLDASWVSVFGIDASGQCNIQDVPLNTEREVTGLKCGVLGQLPGKDQVYFTSFVIADNELSFTTLPNESPDNVGTEAAPAPRNVDLKVKYSRK